MKYGTGQYAPIDQERLARDSERLVPRYDEVIDGSALKLWIALGSGRWEDLRENQRGPWREGARAVLEAAGVERLRAELESCRSVNGALNSKLEGEKLVNELLRKKASQSEDKWLEAWKAMQAERDMQAQRAIAAEKDRDEQKERADEAWAKLSALGADEMLNTKARLEAELAKEKARADRAEAAAKDADEFVQLDYNARIQDKMRIAALEKVVEALREELAKEYQKARLYGAKAQRYREECIARGAPEHFAIIFDEPPCTDVAAIAYAAAIGALDSAQPAPDRKCFCVPGACPDEAKPAPDAGKCAQPSEHHESCNCENQPAPDARDERIRAFQDAARTVPEDTVRLSERLDAANERIRELESELTGKRADAAEWHKESIRRAERIRELEAAHAAERTGYDHTMHLQADQIDQLRERIRVACAELQHWALMTEGEHIGGEMRRIARALEGKDSGQPGESRDATGTVRAGSDSESRAGVFQESPSDIDPDVAEHRTWILEQHARLESRADIRTLCIIAAQYETTVMSATTSSHQTRADALEQALQPTSADSDRGLRYAIFLVERMRARLEETR